MKVNSSNIYYLIRLWHATQSTCYKTTLMKHSDHFVTLFSIS